MGNKVLFVNGPLTGHVFPSLGLVRELSKRGEQVTYCCTSKFQPFVERAGATFLPYPGGAYGELENWDLDKETRITDTEWDLTKTTWTEIVLAGFSKTIKKGEFDYIVHGHTYGAGYELGQLLAIPRICISPDFAKTSEGDSYKFSVGTALLNGLRHSPIVCIKEWLARSRLRSRFRVKPTPLRDLYFSRGDLTLVQTSRLLQPRSEEFDESYVFTGPSMHRDEDVVDFAHIFDDGLPIAYLSFGTVFPSLKLLKRCIQALMNFRGYVVVSTGNKLDLDEIGEVPDNFFVRKFVPQLQILNRTNVFISHGGANSINEALYCNVPLLLIPHACDQFRNAERVEELGAGLSLNRSEITDAQLLNAVNRLLEDPIYAINATRIGQSLRDAGGPRRGADAILAFIDEYKMRFPTSVAIKPSWTYASAQELG
jgi:MGT family glycosyltransferase